MPSFTDTLGRQWNLMLDWDLHEQVRERCGITLLALGDNNCELLVRLHTDFKLLVDVIWVLCEEQAPRLGVVDKDDMPATRQFAKGLGGDVLENAAKALVDAVIDFFPSQGQRRVFAALMDKAREESSRIAEEVAEKTRQLTAAQLASSSADSATNLPPSPESETPEPAAA